MDSGQVLYIIVRLTLGAAAAFFAILLWSKTRDAAWMFMVIGVISSYVEIVYSILTMLGISGENVLTVGSMPLLSIVLPCLPMVFFIAAFAVMTARKFRRNR